MVCGSRVWNKILKLSDTHCHLYFQDFKDDLQNVLNRAWEVGVQMIIVPGIDIETSQQAINLAETDDRIFAAVGVHPNSAVSWDENSLKMLTELTQHPRTAAVGEIGLDYYRNPGTSKLQIRILEMQLQIARDQKKPVILHNRDASDDLYPLMLQWQQGMAAGDEKSPASPGVFHSFSDSHPLIDDLIHANFYFGISGPVTFRNNRSMAECVQRLPIERILIETDSPFLSPDPFRGKRNEPRNVQMITKKIAEIKSILPEQVASKTYQNAEQLFFGEKSIE
jgi:TatD DNase family protein